MLFSVIIPTYNRAAVLGKTLQSVLAQTFRDFEVIVVDDGSSDNTREVVEALESEKIRYYYKQNEERSIARNFGAGKSAGDYLIFLDSDDRMAKEHLERILQYLSATGYKPAFIFSGFSVLNHNGSLAFSVVRDGILRPEKLVYGNMLGCSAVTILSSLFSEFRFDTAPDLIIFEDWELWLRISCITDIHCIPAGTIFMDNHEGRSVLNIESGNLVKKVECLRNKVLGNPAITESTFWNESKFLMGIYSYASLHIALTGKDKKQALKYLNLALRHHASLIFKKRFFAILKRLF